MRYTKCERVSGRYQEALPIKQEHGQPTRKMGKGCEWVFYRYRQGNTCGQEIYKKYSTSFVMWQEMKFRAAMRGYFTPFHLEKLKSLFTSSARADGETGSHTC